MKTTVDLPDALVMQVKLRALHQGQKLKDAVADLLRKGLDSAPSSAVPEPDMESPTLINDSETSLPLIVCKHAALADEELTPERVADILLGQEAEWHHAASR
jgi:hypothetical protein